MKAMAAGGEGGGIIGGMGEMALASAAPEVAVVLAAGDKVMKAITGAWDRMAEQNQQIEKAMGSGLFTPGKTGGEALNTVRQNLGANAFGAFGQNLTRNLAIAQAMREQGLDITELSTGAPGALRNRRLAGGGRPDIGSGMVGGVFGEFQRNVMTAGRAAGLDTPETVARMTKLIHEMRQTFDASHDFLENVNTQARLAGISTASYLKIVDELTDQFDKMNKSFNETVSIVQVLGATGATTADDLKTMADAVTGAGEQKTVEQTAFAFQNMTPEARDAWVAAEQNASKIATGNARKAFIQEGNMSEAEANKLDLTSPGGIMHAQNLLMGMKSRVNPNAIQNIQKTLDEAEAHSLQLNAAQQVQQGNAVGAAIGLQATGTGAIAKTAQQQSLMQTIMSTTGLSIGQLRAHPEQLLTNLAAVEMTKALGMKPEDLMALVKAAGTFNTGMIVQGAKNLPEGMKQQEYRKFFMIGKKTFDQMGIKEGETAKIQKAIDENSTLAAEIAQGMEDQMTPTDFIMGLTTSLDKTNQDKQVKDVAMQTRMSADYYANAFEWLFNMLLQPLLEIASILDGMTHGLFTPDSAKKIKDDKLLSAEYEKLTRSNNFNDAVTGLQSAVDDAGQDPKNAALHDRLQDQLNSLEVLKNTPRDQITKGELASAKDAMATGLVAGMQNFDPSSLNALINANASDPGLQFILKAEGIQKLFAQGGISPRGYTDIGGGQGAAQVDISQSQLSLLQKMKDAGLISGDLKTGSNQTITINAVDQSTQVWSNIVGSAVNSSVGKAGETASPHGATPMPSGAPVSKSKWMGMEFVAP